jgi:hypothetical protein
MFAGHSGQTVRTCANHCSSIARNRRGLEYLTQTELCGESKASQNGNHFFSVGDRIMLLLRPGVPLFRPALAEVFSWHEKTAGAIASPPPSRRKSLRVIWDYGIC